MQEAYVYMYVQVGSDEPTLRVLGNYRPSNKALTEIRNLTNNHYDREKGIEALKDKGESLPQDRSVEDLMGSYVLIGMAKFNKNTGEVDFDPRDYEFSWGGMSLNGRDPSECDKGLFENNENYYPPSESKPNGW